MLKVGSLMISVLDCLPVFLIPWPVPADADLVDRYMRGLSAMAMYRNGQPGGTMGRLDAITIAPAALIVLYIVIKDEDIGFLDLVKITTPGDVGGLQDNATGHMRDRQVIRERPLAGRLLSDYIGWSVHAPVEYTRQVFPEDAQCKELGAAEEGDYRGQEGKARNAAGSEKNH